MRLTSSVSLESVREVLADQIAEPAGVRQRADGVRALVALHYKP